jgi:hypothetical protein
MNQVLGRLRSERRFNRRGMATAPNSPREIGVGVSMFLEIQSDAASKSKVRQTVPDCVKGSSS